MRKIVFFIGVCVLAVPIFASADSGSETRNIILGPEETIEGDFVQAGESLDLSGIVAGDIMVAGGEVDISGTTGGDILVAGGNINISGQAGEDLRVVGGNISVVGPVIKNATIVGGTIRLEDGSNVSGNTYLVGGNITARGTVAGDMTIAGGRVVLSGIIGGNLKIYADEIELRQGARVEGDFTYYSGKDASIAEGVVIVGEVTKNVRPGTNKDFNGKGLFGSALVAFVVWKILASLVVALVAWKLFALRIKESLAKFTIDFWSKLGWGFVTLVATPVAAIIVMFTLIGIPLAVVALLLYAVAVYLGSILGTLMFGRWLTTLVKFSEPEMNFPWISFLLGIVVLAVITLVPFFGFLVQMVVSVWGFGSLLMLFKKQT